MCCECMASNKAELKSFDDICQRKGCSKDKNPVVHEQDRLLIFEVKIHS